MVYYLIVCRSLTFAQRTASGLERVGIAARILRSPTVISGEGCSHCVRIRQADLTRALQALQKLALSPKRIFVTTGDGNYQEVEL